MTRKRSSRADMSFKTKMSLVIIVRHVYNKKVSNYRLSFTKQLVYMVNGIELNKLCSTKYAFNNYICLTNL